MKSDLTRREPRLDRLSRHSETMGAFITEIEAKTASIESKPISIDARPEVIEANSLTKNPSEDEPRFPGTDSISKLLCHCAKESTTPRFQKKALKHFSKMNSIRQTFDETPKAKDTPAVKGILTLFFCIVYAAGLFILAAVVSRVFSFGKTASTTPGVQLQVWESESKKHMELRQSRLVHTRWGQ